MVTRDGLMGIKLYKYNDWDKMLASARRKGRYGTVQRMVLDSGNMILRTEYRTRKCIRWDREASHFDKTICDDVIERDNVLPFKLPEEPMYMDESGR